MRIALQGEVIQLAEGKPLAIRGARGVLLECTDGIIWLTVKGHLDDFWLTKGERQRIENNGLALIEGFQSGSIRLVNDPNNSSCWRIV